MSFLSLHVVKTFLCRTVFGIALALAAVFFYAHPADAAVVTWDGGGGADTNWGTCANWSGNTCPTSIDIATFDATNTNNVTIATTLTGGTAPAGIDINVGYTGIITQNTGVSITVGTSNFDQAAGTFTGSDAPITINGAFVLSGGAFTAPTGANLSVQGNWTHTAGGTFTHNNGTVRFFGGTPDTTIDVNTTESFYHFIEEKTTNWQVILSTGDTATINGTLTLTDGRLMSSTSTSVYDLKGAISIPSTWDSGSANFKFSGTADQSLTLINTSSWDPNGGLTIDKASGNFTLGSALTLDGGGTGANVTLTQGTFNLNGFALRCNDFTHTNGTFTSGAVSVDIDDDLTVSAGTWNASTGSTIVGGDLTVSAGAAFNDNSGSFTFDTAADQTINVDTSETFYDLTIDKGNNQQTITSGDTIAITNTLNLTNGRFQTGTIDMQGATTTVASGYDSGTAVLKFSGTATQTLTMQHASVNNFDGNIVVDKSGGSLTLGSALTLDSGSQTFTLTNGAFSTGNFNLSTLAFSQGGGTFNGGSSTTVDHNGVFTLSSGTYTATSGTTYFADTLTESGGTFAHNGGSVVLDTGSDETYDVSTSITFNNLKINKGLNQVTITSGDTLIVVGLLELYDGRFQTGTLEARGDVTIGTGYAANTAPLLFSGSATQTLTMTGAAVFNADITVNKSGGQVNLSGTLTMDAANQDLTIQEGTFDLNGSSLSVTGAGTERIIVETGGNLQLQGGETITADSASYPQLDSGSTVTYDGGSNITIKDYTYHHLTIAGTTNVLFTLAANEILGGNLTITSGTLNLGGKNLTVTGTFTNDDAIRLQGLETISLTQDTNSGSWVYVGNNDGSADPRTIKDFGVGVDYYNLRINDTSATKDTFSIGANLDCDGTLRVSSSSFSQGTYTLDVGSINVDGGTLTGGSGAMTLTGSLGVTISSGTFTSTSNTLTVVGPWTHTAGGTWAHNSGTVAYTGTSATIDVASTEDFNALNINLTDANTLTVASGDTLIANGALTLTNGTWATGSVRALGNVVVASTWDAGGTGTLDVQGSGTQTLDLTGATAALDNPLVVNKSGGSLTLASAYTLDHVNADFTLTLGTFSTGDFAVTTSAGSDIAVNGGTFNTGASTMTVAGALTVAGGTYNGDTSTGVVSGAFLLSSGAYNGNTSTPTFSGGLTISGGTLTASSGTTTVSGAWTHTAGGAFTHNSGTVAFTGNSVTVDVASTETFSALTINKTDGQTLTVASGDALITTGTLTLTDGAVGTGTLEAQAGVTVGANADGGDATLKFSGGNGQTFNLTGATDKWNGNITVEKTDETVTLGSALVMDSTGDLTITSGSFATGGYAVTTSAGADLAINGGALSAGASTMTIAGALTIAGGTYNGNTSTGTISGAFTLSSGAYNGNTSTPTFSGALGISGGTFTSTSGTMTVSGGWTHTAGGTFTHNDGVVTFTGNGATIDVSTSETFNGLTINKADGQTLTVASGDSLIASGTITLTDGAVGTGTLDARGNVTVSSTYDGGNAPLKFAGGAAQSFDLTGATGKYDGDIEVAKSADTVSLASNLVMDAAGQDLTVTTGTFSANTRNLTVAGNVAANGGTLNLSTGTIDLNGNLTVGGGTLNMSSATVTLAGNATYSSGTMTPGTSSVTLDGTNQEFSGATSWYTLIKNVTSAATLTFPSGTTTTVSNTFTLSGQTGQLLSIRSSTNGQRHTLAVPTRATSYSYLDIQDSEPTATLTCLLSPNGCVDSGNNHSFWKFRNTGSSTAPSSTGPNAGVGSDGSASASRALTLLTPNGGEEVVAGSTTLIQWTTTGSVERVNIEYSDDDGTTWDAVADNVLNADVYVWTVPLAVTSEAKIKIEGTDLVEVFAEDQSAAAFWIVASAVAEDEAVDDEEIADDEEVVVADPVEVAEIAERVASLPEEVAIHGLVKLADDGDSTTQADSAVYYVGADGKRHAFPNPAVYFSWFCDFSNVQIVSAEDLAAIEFGANITYRPGYRMVKFQTSPKVYAVDRLGVLRWVATEELATALYGEDWNTKIDDISDAFFGNYTFGTPISDAAEYNAEEAKTNVVYPSDSMDIPGYSHATGGLVCEE
ncbi:hypothetical protein HYS28_00365 [Candidatus Uhrbacteria bacterium]|nr:hypothetical protein [Candidatus Uhrbacteria bacterium]